MRLADFDFHLPESRIALRPASPRDSARLLVVAPGEPLQDRKVRDLPALLSPGDALVFNDTRVIPARLKGERRRDASVVAVEVTLHRRLSSSRWAALCAKPGRRLAAGDRINFGETDDRACLLGALDATVAEKGEGGEVTLAFDLAGPDLDLAIAERGMMPLPPYIAAPAGPRTRSEQDRRDYQTVYAREDRARWRRRPRAYISPPSYCGRPHRTRGVSSALRNPACEAPAPSWPVKNPTISGRTPDARRIWQGEQPLTAHEALNAVRAAGGRVIARWARPPCALFGARRADEGGRLRPFAGETAIFITPRLRFPRRGGPDDQFPSAEIDLVHAGGGVPAGWRPCARPMPTPRGQRLPGSIPMATPPCSGATPDEGVSLFRIEARGRAGRGQCVIETPRGGDLHPRLHAGGHGGLR